MLFKCFLNYTVTNCFISILNKEGKLIKVFSWGQERKHQFSQSKKGVRKLDPIFGFSLGERAGLFLRKKGGVTLEVFLKNPLNYRLFQFFHGLRKTGLVLKVYYCLGAAHNGCRKPKRRRV